MSKLDMSELFASMAREERPPESASLREQRRARIVGSMRELHVRLVHERPRGFTARKTVRWLLIAASLAMASAALARVAGLGTWTGASTPAERPAGSHPSSSRAGAPPDAPPATTPSAHAMAPAASEALPAAPAPAVAPSARVREHAAGRTHANPADASQLEAINRLFAEARHARREGRDATALALVEQLLDKYPSSVLAQEASVERFRALSKLGRAAEARRRAASYLARYPGGFATEEARRLLASPEIQ